MIGIIGGVGPLAGILMAKNIIVNNKVNTDQEHIPFILTSFSNLIQDRTEYLLGKVSENPAIPISKQILAIEALGVKRVIIACNTAHSHEILNVIKSNLGKHSSKVEIVNIVLKTIDFLKQEKSIKRIGVLSTLGTRKIGVYKKALAGNGFDFVDLTEELAEKMHSAIYHPDYGIKSLSEVADKSLEIIYDCMDYLHTKNVESIILGCTEIPLAIKESRYKEMLILDPMKITAKFIIQNREK